MSWETCESFMNDDFIILAEDGEFECMKFLAEPKPAKGKSFGQERYRFLFPVATESGNKIFCAGKKTARKIESLWSKLAGQAVMVTRRGAAGNTKTFYDVEIATSVASNRINPDKQGEKTVDELFELAYDKMTLEEVEVD